jgi:hypothetical protein
MSNCAFVGELSLLNAVSQNHHYLVQPYYPLYIRIVLPTTGEADHLILPWLASDPDVEYLQFWKIVGA